MAKRIYKYTLQPERQVKMPLGAQITSVETQAQEIYAWAVVDTDQQLTEYRKFLVFATGQDLPDGFVHDDGVNNRFLGLVKMQDTFGAYLMFHVYEDLT